MRGSFYFRRMCTRRDCTTPHNTIPIQIGYGGWGRVARGDAGEMKVKSSERSTINKIVTLFIYLFVGVVFVIIFLLNLKNIV